LLPEEVNALRKACLYSEPPNKLGYCGPDQSWKAFEQFLKQPSEQNTAETKELLTGFYGLVAYLDLIASANNRQPFDREVIEAYWLGNSLLENVHYSELQKTILSLQKHGLPRLIAEKKASQLPEEMLPHHSMHVLYVNFITPKVEPIIKNLSDCLIQWAIVKGLSSKGIKVKGVELFSESNELKLRESLKTVQNPFGLQLKPKDIITVHWGNAIEVVSEDEQTNLKKFTERTLKAVQAQ